MMSDLDRRLRADGAHWRASGHTVPPLQAALAAVTGVARDAAAQTGRENGSDTDAEVLLINPTFDPGSSSISGGRHRRRWLVAAAVAGVGLVAGGVAALANTGSNPAAPPDGVPQAEVVGYRWRLTQVIDEGGTLAVSGRPVILAFTPDGYLLGNDGCNGLEGRYRFHDGGYTVHDVSGTWKLCTFPAGSAPARIMSAVDAAFNLASSGLGTHESPDIAARLDGSTLYLTASARSVRIVAVRAGKQSNAVTSEPPTNPIPSTTPTPPTH